ncbi:hypothetical protein SBA5_430002 [Candidatus Sulfotelmatomonas gaucii]|uniref:Uncharacterized protein n=1 Tax=Candidatus Sulfuritelmatomonas gaucii TaxID=2043161 RepID=A0A2N9LLY5_9BACT|nr:hypothetical protein SBA5_430002 [Candidatus Sulfotelmatomonas gaucii]
MCVNRFIAGSKQTLMNLLRHFLAQGIRYTFSFGQRILFVATRCQHFRFRRPSAILQRGSLGGVTER